MEGNGGAAGTHGGVEGTAVSSRPSGDVDIQEGQDDETFGGWDLWFPKFQDDETATNLAEVVAKTMAKVKWRTSINVTEDVLYMRNLDYRLGKTEEGTNLVCNHSLTRIWSSYLKN